MNPVYNFQMYFYKFHSNINLSPTSTTSKKPVFFRFSNQYSVYMSHFSHSCYTTRLSRPHSFDYTSNLIFGEAYTLCSLAKPSATSSLFDRNILLSILFSDILCLYFPLVWETKFRTHTKQKVKLHSCIF